MNTNALYDVLYILDSVEDLSAGLRSDYLHGVLYLSCLLSLVDGQTVSQWGYQFAETTKGGPFSDDIYTAVEFLSKEGLLEEDTKVDRVFIGSEGKEKLKKLKVLKTLYWRNRFHDAVAYALLRLSIQQTIAALKREPTFEQVDRLKKRSILFDETSVKYIRKGFDLIIDLIGRDASRYLRLVSVMWLETILEDWKNADAEGVGL